MNQAIFHFMFSNRHFFATFRLAIKRSSNFLQYRLIIFPALFFPADFWRKTLSLVSVHKILIQIKLIYEWNFEINRINRFYEFMNAEVQNLEFFKSVLFVAGVMRVDVLQGVYLLSDKCQAWYVVRWSQTESVYFIYNSRDFWKKLFKSFYYPTKSKIHSNHNYYLIRYWRKWCPNGFSGRYGYKQ